MITAGRGFSVLTGLCLLAGCTTARLPLCPRLAEASYPPGSQGRGQVVNYYLQRNAAAAGISVRPLSSFVAEYSGSSFSMEPFVQNYPAMLCAFDSRQIVNDQTTYQSCTMHAPDWVALVQSGAQQRLMDDSTYFWQVCGALPG